MANYLCRNRPPGMGCQPDGFTEIETWYPARPVGHRHFFGRISYPEPLGLDQVHRYELWPEDEVERAEYVFWLEGKDAAWLRADYLSLDEEVLAQYAARDQKAQAALILKRAGVKVK